MRAFTLIEILVVVAVSVIVMGSFIAYNSVIRAQVALSVEQAKIAQVILRAKSLAISSYFSSFRCGYGFSVDYTGRSYSLNRYDVSSDADCDAIYTGRAGFENTSAVPLETHSLDSNLDFQASGASDKLEEVLFIAPEPKTFIKVGGFLFRGTAKIYLETKTTPLRGATVNVNSVGQVGF
ncbi:MAG: prepilin-type N-terminal cleavage/methylation domain-containing protein [Candidatus Liptonbacteria bacterium]|nr:prepilin-type N-terminal cleavage/methylation domain-containing protein [Candidatus Liptonbacteria bacterium]